MNNDATPSLPHGSHGVTMKVLSADPLVALLEFEPGGVLGEDVHPDYEEIGIVFRGSISSNVDPGRVPAGVAHSLAAGAEGAMVLVTMVPRQGGPQDAGGRP